MRVTTLVQHTIMCHCVSQNNVAHTIEILKLELGYFEFPAPLPTLAPTLLPHSCFEVLHCPELFFASPLRVRDGGIPTHFNVINWSLTHGRKPGVSKMMLK